ncbi:hypothetical protein FB446DRAFT_795790 [Lentinula raphanica]|nr:hypothetical protein C8R42DRAFT_640662 [Lentinula raphanica]KAJ3764732.1 hypothetical protein FB446DRAFT_795790 [Lentinula raphanica]
MSATNAISKVTSSKRGSRKRSRGDEVGSGRMKRRRRAENEERSYEPGSWVMEKLFTGDSKIGEEIVRLFVVDQSGYVASPISSLPPENSNDQRHRSACLSVNTRFVRRYRDGANLITSSNEVNSAAVASRNSSTLDRRVTDSLGTGRKHSSPHQGWAFAVMNRTKKETPHIQLCCCLPDEEVDALKDLDIEDTNGNEGDSDLEDIDADLVYPDDDAGSPVK